ncbi:MAG: 50S ribosomal protein L1 [Actinobacteria bacterium]|nr:50S ribosomal protein L1 [Actinomycetota bacterium]
MKRSKKYIAAAAKIDADRLYTPLEAVTLVRETSTTKYDATIDVALCLGVDPKKADQAIRSTVNLPHGTGKTGRLDFDAVVATPDLMGKVGRLGKVLGPRNLMPNPKTGTVTTDVTKAVNDIKGGKVEFRIDKNSNLHFIIGKASFTAEQLAENYAAALDEVHRSKPNSSKGRFIKRAVISTTMGPGINIDPNLVREPAAQ